MTTHLDQHRAKLKTLAFPAVERFITNHPEYTISPNQSGSEGNTNYVIFGQRHQEPIIFKFFCTDERKEREVYALRHFGSTGIVPTLIADVDERLIVQSRIPGGWLPNPDNPAYDRVKPDLAGDSLGNATATFLSVPLSEEEAHNFESRFYEGLTLENYFRTILDASWLIHQRVMAYGSPLFAQSLATIEANLPYILSQKRLIYHQDAMNMHFLESHFAGFFDLEMCRVGTEAMQIGSLWYTFALHRNWDSFAEGYATISQKALDENDFSAAHAFAHFMIWRYISRSGRWRAEPNDTESLAQDEGSASEYAQSLILNNQVQFLASH